MSKINLFTIQQELVDHFAKFANTHEVTCYPQGQFFEKDYQQGLGMMIVLISKITNPGAKLVLYTNLAVFKAVNSNLHIEYLPGIEPGERDHIELILSSFIPQAP